MSTTEATRSLSLGDCHLLDDPGPGIEVEPSLSDPTGASAFLKLSVPGAAWRSKARLGRPRALVRYLACYRYDPYWMRPGVGNDACQVPADTQYLLFERSDGRFVLIVPLPDEPYHASLQGTDEGLSVVLDSGAPGQGKAQALAVYVGYGNDPFELMHRSAGAVLQRLGRGRRRNDKQLPPFVDFLGWCTWDSFYRDVSADKVALGLESFKQGGIEPRFMILDDGWQTVSAPTNEGRLTAFHANEKFGGSLLDVVALAKGRYSIAHFLVWHAVHGYWSGADPEALPGFEIQRVLRWYSPEVLSHAPGMNAEYCDPYVDRPARERLFDFYDTYHRLLASQGVDGVKVDNQSSAEGLAHPFGGRVADLSSLRLALERSAGKHFAGSLIHCMGCASELLYFCDDSSLTRTSTDFWPNKPASHGLHLYTNAMVGLWFGEFIQPDWDMFQSGHAAGAYHAAARAISGGPVYVSDTPEGHDFELLGRLVLTDGSVLRAADIARPTRDSLFLDPTAQPCLLKLFNRNLTSVVLAAFNANYEPTGKDKLRGTLGLQDVPGLDLSDTYAAYAEQAARLSRLDAASAPLDVELGNLQFEIVTLVAIREGMAALGLLGKFNSGAAITRTEHGPGTLWVELRDGGQALFYCETKPERVTVDGAPGAEYDYEPATGRLVVELALGALHVVELERSRT